MKITDKAKQKWKNSQFQRKKKKEQERRDLEEARRIHKLLPNKVKEGKSTKIKNYCAILYFIIGAIFLLILVSKALDWI